MRVAEWINLCTFALFGVMAWVCRLPPHCRARALLICNAAILLVLCSMSLGSLLPQSSVSVLRDWLPALLILLAYWTAGAFVSTPDERLQNALLALDARLFNFKWLQHATSNRLLNTYFEIAYLLCYPLIPAAVGALYWYRLRQHVDDYWSVVLPSTYLCYLMQPLVSALPPRLICADPMQECNASFFRRFNLLINRRASIRVITLPSAHVASTMAASLVLLRLVPRAGVLFLLLSLSIASAAVAGRYHYAADAVLGIAVSLVVFLITVPFVT
jgi:hypothetical protein